MGEFVKGADFDGAEGSLFVVKAGRDGFDGGGRFVELAGDELLAEGGVADRDAEDADAVDEFAALVAVEGVLVDGAVEGRRGVRGAGAQCREDTLTGGRGEDPGLLRVHGGAKGLSVAAERLEEEFHVFDGDYGVHVVHVARGDGSAAQAVIRRVFRAGQSACPHVGVDLGWMGESRQPLERSHHQR